MAPTRQVINSAWVTDFLQYVLDDNQSFTVLIVCAARDAFLEQLLAAVHHQTTESAGHQLLMKTLGMLSSTRNTRTVFCPTLEHLRAYLATGVASRVPVVEGKEQTKALLTILNPLSLHLSTREFSAQGLSRTVANAVEVSSRMNMDIVLCECRDSLDPTNDERGEALWYVDVPLLSNSQRAAAEGSHWPGRAVPIKRIVQRWFQFTGLSKKGYMNS